jgi:hypothetical protein
MSQVRGTYHRFMHFAACAGLLVAGGSPLWFDAHVSAEQTHNLHLTHIQPHAVIAVIAVPDAVLQRVPSLLLLPVTQISNETLTPVSVYAYLTWSDPKGSHRLARLLLGQISIFPTNQPGTFTIELSQEFQELLKHSPEFRQLSPSLLLELRPIHSQALPAMDFTIGPVEWHTAEETTAG